VIAIRVPLEVGGVPVHAGELIGADYDGCVVVPRAIKRALEKVAGENTMRVVLRRGTAPASF
jgi:regulator of RNase E activity RraA